MCSLWVVHLEGTFRILEENPDKQDFRLVIVNVPLRRFIAICHCVLNFMKGKLLWLSLRGWTVCYAVVAGLISAEKMSALQLRSGILN